MTRFIPRRRPLSGRLLLLGLAPLIAGCGTPQAITKITSAPTPVNYPAPAIVVVENHPDSHPHAGLQKADIVFEYLTEGNISRFTAIYFHPSGAGRIEPVRSTRLITIRLQKAYHGLIFTSGASSHVIGLLYSGHIPFVTEGSSGGRYFERDPNRFAPHNLYTTLDQLRDGVTRSKLRIPYQPPAPAEPDTKGTAANKVALNQTPDERVNYVYSTGQKAYEYFWHFSGYSGGPEIDTDNGNRPVMVTNVVVLYAVHKVKNYTEDVLGAKGVDWLLEGTGNADIFTRGMKFTAKWDMTHVDQPLKLVDATGKPVKLPAGLTWIHVVDPGTPVAVS